MKHQRSYLFALFFVSGFSGLIYESIWTHYLKLFLGHAAYAQSLVLMIFMGGMALGAWFCSRVSLRWRNLLLAYAFIEGLIGLAALFFHPLFQQITSYAFNTIFPLLGEPALISSFKWGLASLLVLPQSVLLGMTFPLMSGGVLRRFPEQPGSSIAMLYFTNSFGGALGVLVSGFLTIKWFGLSGTILMAGFINLLLAGVVWRYSKAFPEHRKIVPELKLRDAKGAGFNLMLAIAMLTGMASFIYEISWIRMLSLVLGSSTQAFELMLSAFILGLASGGYWLHKRIDRLKNTLRTLAVVQILMGLAALVTLPLYGKTFNLMQWLVLSVNKDDLGFIAFNLASHGLALLIMFPTAFCAGMTLPLITHYLMQSGYGERSIGSVYGVNTLGAILGTIITVHIGFPLLGLKGSMVGGAIIDIGLGSYLCFRCQEQTRLLRTRLIPVGILSVVFVVFFVQLDPHKMASGVFRTGELLSPDSIRVLKHTDGKTATINLTASGKDAFYSILTNGKSDASINMTGVQPTFDQVTMTLIAGIPSLLRPNATEAANIGFGSGLTSHVLLGNPNIEVLDTIEIEPAMVETARLMEPWNSRVYNDPRSNIHIEDAKTFFSTNQKQYDLILSEPSNPWVSGVAGLFSLEFYRHIKRYLAKDGLFAQWLQVYEFDQDLLYSVLKAISSEFENFTIYGLSHGDLLILASDSSIDTFSSGKPFAVPEMAPDLATVGVLFPDDLRFRWLGDRAFMMPLLSQSSVPVNSDYFPYIDQHAVKARFLSHRIKDIYSTASELLPVRKILAEKNNIDDETSVAPTGLAVMNKNALEATYLYARLTDGDNSFFSGVRRDFLDFREADQKVQDCKKLPQHGDKIYVLHQIAMRVLPYLSQRELQTVWRKLEALECGSSLKTYEARWLELYRAIGREDLQAMGKISQQLIEKPQFLTKMRARYLLGIGMLSHLAQGGNKETLALWQKYAPKWFGDEEPDAQFRYLVATAEQGHPKP